MDICEDNDNFFAATDRFVPIYRNYTKICIVYTNKKLIQIEPILTSL